MSEEVDSFSEAVIDVVARRINAIGKNANSFAPLVGMSQPTLSRTLNKRRAFNSEELTAIAKVLKVRVSSIFHEAETMIGA